MSNKEIDDFLRSQGNAPDPARLAGVTASIASRTIPVRPLPSSSMLAAGLLSICAVVPSIIAATLGFQGVRQLGTARIGVIFSILLLFTILAAGCAQDIERCVARIGTDHQVGVRRLRRMRMPSSEAA